MTEERPDCHARLIPGEPSFTLMARDPHAPDVIRKWATMRFVAIVAGERPKEDIEQAFDAMRLAKQMEMWRAAHDGEWRKGNAP